MLYSYFVIVNGCFSKIVFMQMSSLDIFSGLKLGNKPDTAKSSKLCLPSIDSDQVRSQHKEVLGPWPTIKHTAKTNKMVCMLRLICIFLGLASLLCQAQISSVLCAQTFSKACDMF